MSQAFPPVEKAIRLYYENKNRELNPDQIEQLRSDLLQHVTELIRFRNRDVGAAKHQRTSTSLWQSQSQMKDNLAEMKRIVELADKMFENKLRSWNWDHGDRLNPRKR